MKKIILSLLAALALVAGLSVIAEAKTNFNLYLGVPYYDYQVAPDYLFDENQGWYQPDYQPNYQPAYHTGGGSDQSLYEHETHHPTPSQSPLLQFISLPSGPCAAQ